MKLTEKSENRKFADDPWHIAVARGVFVKWMKSRGLWGGYIQHLNKHPSMKMDAWDRPNRIKDLLGSCSYEYTKAYLPWCDYVDRELDLEINRYINECIEGVEVC